MFLKNSRSSQSRSRVSGSVLTRLTLPVLALFLMAFTFKVGDVVEIEKYFNGRATPDFRKETQNIRLSVPPGSHGKILQLVKFNKTGNYGMKVLLENGKHQKKEVWVYYNTRLADPGIKLFKSAEERTPANVTQRPDEATAAQTTQLMPGLWAAPQSSANTDLKLSPDINAMLAGTRPESGATTCVGCPTHNAAEQNNSAQSVVVGANPNPAVTQPAPQVTLNVPPQTVTTKPPAAVQPPPAQAAPVPAPQAHVPAAQPPLSLRVAPNDETVLQVPQNEANTTPLPDSEFCETHPKGWERCTDPKTRSLRRFKFQTTASSSDDSPSRIFSFEFPGNSRQDLQFSISHETGDNATSRLSTFVVFPRKVRPAINQLPNGNYEVILPTQERVEYNPATGKIVNGVLLETAPMSLKPSQIPAVEYRGTGVVIRLNENMSVDHRIEGGGEARITKPSTGQSCTLSARSLWTERNGQMKGEVSFNYASDEAFDAVLRQKCGFSMK